MCIHVKFDIHLAVVASDMAGILQALHTFALLQEVPAMQSLESALNAKAAIGLDAMDSVALMDRFDEMYLMVKEGIEHEFNASSDELDEEFNQETEEELLDIPTFLRRQAN